VQAIGLKTIELDFELPRRQTSMAISSARAKVKDSKGHNLDVGHGTLFLLVTIEENGKIGGTLIWRRLDQKRQGQRPTDLNVRDSGDEGAVRKISSYDRKL